MTIQHKPLKKTLHGLPQFTIVRRDLRFAARSAGAPLARQRLISAHHTHQVLPQSLMPRRFRSCGSGSHDAGRVHRLVRARRDDGAGLPGPGDASLIAAGTLAGEGRLNVAIVLAVSAAAWMLGSVVGYEIGFRKGRWLLDHPGRLEKRRLELLAKGDRAFGRHTFLASVMMPAYVSGIFRVSFPIFLLGALVSGIFWVGMYVGLSYFLGAEVVERIGDAGTSVLLGVLVIVAVGLGIRAAYSRWRAARHERSA